MPYRHVRPSIAVACLTVLIAAGSASTTAGADPIATSPGIGLTPTSDVVIPLRQITGLDLPSLHLSGLMRHPIGTVAATGDRPLADAFALHVQPEADPGTGNPVETRLPGDAPNIITRARWGAGNVSQCTPTVTRHARSTAGDTGPAMSDGIVHALYDYRTNTLHRCDIGYNALIDKRGQAFDGRSGKFRRMPQAAQAGDLNQANFGIGLLDNDTANRIGPGLVLALARMLAGTSPAPASAAAPLSTPKPIAAGNDQPFGLANA